MGYNRKAQRDAILSGSAPKFQYLHVPGVHYTLGDALANWDKFLDYKVRETVTKLLHNFEPFEQVWINYCDERSHSLADGYHSESGDDEGAWNLLYEAEQEIFEDAGRRVEWLRRKVCEQLPSIKAEIREQVNTPGGLLESENQEYPTIGVFSKGRNYPLPLDLLCGFCPGCHEPLLEEDFYDKLTRLNCSACVAIGDIAEIEEIHRRNYDVMPFSDILLKDFVQAQRRLASA